MWLIAARRFFIQTENTAEELQSSGWYRYANDFFIAYSNVDYWQMRKILEDLEYLRAATPRVPDIEIPCYADKTLV